MDKEASQEQTESADDKSTWAHDQQNRDYYYDDSHGYEIYNPDEDDDEQEKSDSAE